MPTDFSGNEVEIPSRITGVLTIQGSKAQTVDAIREAALRAGARHATALAALAERLGVPGYREPPSAGVWLSVDFKTCYSLVELFAARCDKADAIAKGGHDGPDG